MRRLSQKSRARLPARGLSALCKNTQRAATAFLESADLQKSRAAAMPFDPIPAPSSLSRRRALRVLGGTAGALVLAACGGGSSDDATLTSSSGTTTSTGSTTSSGTCSEIPEETNGPFPADGSQSGVTNVLADSRVIRSNIVSDFAGTNTQTGVPLTLTISVQDISNGCSTLEGAAVYIWHCNADGEYSVYSGNNNGNHSGQTFLRGAQVTDSNGQVTFTSIYPGRYAGRATHIHVEVYSSSTFKTLLKTSQFAFVESVNDTVYTTSAYSDSEATTETTNAQDNVFSDGYDDELLTLSGNTSSGYTAAIAMGISAT
jgi:protocatechuate 3,4-dioxygenase beta subunit